jgi:hypothetical protein
MPAQIGIPADASTEQLHIIIGALYLSLAYTLRHVTAVEGPTAAGAFKDRLLTAVKNGDLDMSLLDDAKTYDLVVSMIEGSMDAKEHVS